MSDPSREAEAAFDSIPALSPSKRPCRGLGRPMFIVGVRFPNQTMPLGGSRFRLCRACRDAAEAQAYGQHLAFDVEDLP